MKPISKTAFYCCGIRMQDAESSNPACGDTYASSFMNEDGLKILETFKDETAPNASNVARHRIIDDLLKNELSMNPSLSVVLIGAGFDSRAYRLKGGRWIEFDEPQVIEYKNAKLPISQSENELHRIPIDFSTESLEEKLLPFATNEPVVFVIEGVFMYLDQLVTIELLQTLHKLFPRHKVICDLMTREFFEKYGKKIHEKLTGMGASFKFTVESPEELFETSGYKLIKKISIVESAVKYGLLKIPKIALKLFLRALTGGYAIYVFEVT